MSCEHCTDPNGDPCYPMYGVGPHTCFYKIPGAKMGESRPLPREQWPDNYQEDPECQQTETRTGLGVWWCPKCGDGKPSSAGESQK